MPASFELVARTGHPSFLDLVAGTRRDETDDPSGTGVAIEAHFFANATVKHNTVVASPGGIQAFNDSTITR